MRIRAVVVGLVAVLVTSIVAQVAPEEQRALAEETSAAETLVWSLPSATTVETTLNQDGGVLQLASSDGGETTGDGAVLATSSSSSSDVEAPGEWPMGNRSLARSGNASWDEFISVPMVEQWSRSISDKVQTNPAVVDDVVYFGGAGSDRRVYAVDLQTGVPRWIVQIPGSVLSSPAVAGNWVYFGGADGRLYRVSALDGALSWSYPPSSQSSVGQIVGGPAVHDGVVFFGAMDGKLYAVDAETGALRWSVTTPEAISAAVAVANGKVFVTSGANEWVTAYDEVTGDQLWQRFLYTESNANIVGTAPSVSATGRVYVAGLDAKLYILDAGTGANVATPPSLTALAQNTPVIVPGEDAVFVGSNDGRVSAFSSIGTLRWRTTLPASGIVASPIYSSGLVFAASSDGTLYALSTVDGSIKWGLTTGGPLFAPPAIVSGHVIVGSDDRNLYGLVPGLPQNRTFPTPPIEHRFGVRADEAYAADPVSTSTGNFTYRALDAHHAGRGLPTMFARSYNSLDVATDGPFGFGWTHNYNIAVSGDPATRLLVRWGDGRQDVYTANGDGTYTGPPDTRESLRSTVDGYELTSKDDLTLRFDTAGTLLSVSDRSSNTTTLTYNTDGRLVTVTDPSNRTLSLGYNSGGRVSSLIDALGRSWAYGYDAGGNLSTATDPAGGIWRYEHDTQHRLVRLTNPAGDDVVVNSYGADGKVTEQTDGAGGRWTYTYAASTTTVTDPLGNPTVYEFDADYRTRKITNPLGATTEFVWDATSNLVAVVDPTGAVTRYAYDERGNRTAVLNPAGHKMSLSYDAADNLTTITDGKGGTQTLTYDAASRLTSVSSAAGVRTDIAYLPDGRPHTVTAGDGGVRRYAYSTDGLLTSVTDALGRITTVDLDKSGQLLAVTDPGGNTTRYAYDATGRLTKVTDANGHVSTYGYDAAGRVTTVTDPKGATTQYQYESRGLPATVIDPLGRRTEFIYDLARRLTSRTDPRGLTVTYDYDAAGRSTRVDLPDVADTTFAYDAAGRVTAMNDAAGTHSYTYDPAGRLISEHQLLFQHSLPGGYESDLTYTYDSLGRRKSLELTHYGSRSLHNVYDYDADGRIASLTDTIGGVTNFAYDQAGRIETITNPSWNTVVSNYDYDLAGQLLQLAHRHAGVFVGTLDDALSTWEYQYDAAGRRSAGTRRLVAAGTEVAAYDATYAYDAVGQLLAASNTDPQAPLDANATYTYDAAGNRASRTVAGATTNYAYDAADQLTSDGTNIYEHDEAGNLVAVTPLGVTTPTRSYTYDSLSRLAAISDGAATTTYAYDGLDRRVSKTDDTGVGGFVFDGLDMLEEFGGLTTAVNTTVGGFVLNHISSNPVYLHPDGNGNVGETTDIDGFVLSRHAYEPFGGHTTTAVGTGIDNLNNRHTFAGSWGVRDETAGLLDMRARMYDPSLGRFLNTDPFPSLLREPWLANPYGYAGNNPISFLDPYGLFRIPGTNITIGEGCAVGYASSGGCVGGSGAELLGDAAAAAGNLVQDAARSGVGQAAGALAEGVSIGTGAAAGVTGVASLMGCGVCIPATGLLLGVSTGAGYVSTAIDCAAAGWSRGCAAGVALSLAGTVGNKALVRIGSQFVLSEPELAAANGVWGQLTAGIGALAAHK